MCACNLCPSVGCTVSAELMYRLSKMRALIENSSKAIFSRLPYTSWPTIVKDAQIRNKLSFHKVVYLLAIFMANSKDTYGAHKLW